MRLSETMILVRKAVNVAGSHQSLAEKLGVTRQMITRWANGGGMNLQHYIAVKEFVERHERRNKN